MLLSIVNSTRRIGGFDVLCDSLGRQTIWRDLVESNDVELIVVDELQRDPRRQDAADRLRDNLGLPSSLFTHVYPTDYEPRRFSKLCRAQNCALALARGDYWVPHNDYIWSQGDALERMLALMREYQGRALISCLNDRCEWPPRDALRPEDDDRSYSIFREDFTGERWGFPDVPQMIRRDERRTAPRVHRNYVDVEMPVAMVPTKLLRDVGGWDEAYDLGYAMDNQMIAAHIMLKNPDVVCLTATDVQTISLSHLSYFRDPKTMAQACAQNRVRFNQGLVEAVRTRTPGPSIAFYLGESGWGSLSSDLLRTSAVGGRERAAIRLAQELVKLGWNVAMFAPGRVSVEETGITWFFAGDTPLVEKELSRYDVVVSVEQPALFRKVRAKLNVLHEQCCHLAVGKLDRQIDHYFLLSGYQQWSLRHHDPLIDADKCVVFGNGIDLAAYDGPAPATVPGRLVYSSSPDRGLRHLLRWWPALKATHPHLTLKVFYKTDALDAWRWTHEIRAEWAREVAEGAALPGVEYVGPVDAATLAREQRQAELFVYPCDPAAETESYCITALENAAAGVPMLLSTADCLPEVYHDAAWFAHAPPLDADWIAAIGRMLDDPEQARRFVTRARALAEHSTWEKIASRWDAFLRERLTLTDPEAILRLCEDATHRATSVGWREPERAAVAT